MDQSELTGKIIGCALKVHSILGPGLLESAYRICLIHDLQEKQQLEDSTTRSDPRGVPPGGSGGVD